MSEIICRRIDEQTPSEDGEVGERALMGSGRKVCAGKAHRSTSGRGVAPSIELQRWYGHHPQRFGAFRRRYLTELGDQRHKYAAARLRDLAQHRSLTLLT
ncbi:DUF488 family protein [Streptomyces sp. CA-142005]|uniref:DUF488 family protein, N3 subclade n=1 Tax=Streptomyces sp. CA-142005 TaxID=3240052 RepID=UPI003D9233FD